MADERAPTPSVEEIDFMSIKMTTGEILKGIAAAAPVIVLLVGIAWSISARLTVLEGNQAGLKDQINEIRLQLNKVESNQNKVLFTLHIPQDPPSGFYIWPNDPHVKADPPKPDKHSLADPFTAGVNFSQQVPPQDAAFKELQSVR